MMDELSLIVDEIYQYQHMVVNFQHMHLEIFNSVRQVLADIPAVVYKSEINWIGPTLNTYQFIVVVPTENQFEILRIERTEASNYGLSTEDIVFKLKELDIKVGVDIEGATRDGVEIKLKRMPRGAKLSKLEKWLLDFCPDLYQSQEDITSNTIFLWWD